MTLELSLGSWMLPAIFTFAAIGGWFWLGVKEQPRGGSMFPDFGGMLMEMGGYVIAILVSVIAWLVWALFL